MASMPVGLLPDATYESNRCNLHTGDRLILVTDGVTEAENADGEFFDNERLEAVAARYEKLQDIFSAVTEFCAGTPLKRRLHGGRTAVHRARLKFNCIKSFPRMVFFPAMNFTLLDWSAIVVYLGITLALGLYFRSRSGKSVDDYFVSGRNVSWWLAGTSMVATTFAADTPLVVTGLVYTQGIAGNWLWWAFLLSGMMTVFLFARLWRRSGLLTDVQFAEMRYSGKPAAFLRGFRAVYLGLLMNCLILGWVTKAMTSIVAVLWA